MKNYVLFTLIALQIACASPCPAQPIVSSRVALERLPVSGLQFYPVTRSLRKLAKLPKKASGMVVVDVATASPAEAAGMHTGDLVTAINGITVDKSMPRFLTASTYRKPFTYTVLRGQETLTFTFLLVPAASIQSPDFQQDLADTQRLSELFQEGTAWGIRYNYNDGIGQLIKVKQKIHKLCVTLENRANAQGKPLLAEKYRLIDKK